MAQVIIGLQMQAVALVLLIPSRMNDSAGFVPKQLSGKRNPSNTTCVAKDSVANPDNVVTMQLYKTRICSFYDAGRCGLANCKFAHGACQLKNAPNLKKTKLCFDFLRGCCPKGDSCSFAHCNEDLRVTEGVYKTQLCHFFQNGYCKKGDRCKHAHGERDLRRTSSGTSLHTPSVEYRIQCSLPLADLLAKERPADMSSSLKSVPTRCFSSMVASPVSAGALPVRGYSLGTRPETLSSSAFADSQAPSLVYLLSPTSVQLWVSVPLLTQLQPQILAPMPYTSQPQLNPQLDSRQQQGGTLRSTGGYPLWQYAAETDRDSFTVDVP